MNDIQSKLIIYDSKIRKVFSDGSHNPFSRLKASILAGIHGPTMFANMIKHQIALVPSYLSNPDNLKPEELKRVVQNAVDRLIEKDILIFDHIAEVYFYKNVGRDFIHRVFDQLKPFDDRLLAGRKICFAKYDLLNKYHKLILMHASKIAKNISYKNTS